MSEEKDKEKKYIYFVVERQSGSGGWLIRGAYHNKENADRDADEINNHRLTTDAWTVRVHRIILRD